MLREERLRFRQIHLDFHTHGCIEGIGADFDPEKFAHTLKSARVNSINLFAKGHHGHIYYDTEKFPYYKHPNLQCDLLEQQIEACHKYDIQAPIYITVQYDALTAQLHPEWLVRLPDGRHEGPGFYQPGFNQRVCLNTPYRDMIKELISEVFERMPVDGIWLDIVDARDCSCRFCRDGMTDLGLDPTDENERKNYGKRIVRDFRREISSHIRSIQKESLIFYNAGHIGPATRPSIEDYSHFELESLPYGWGYVHMPTTARYARTLGKDFLGMTGKFHTKWGDFHSFKNPAALAFECYTSLAMGGKCCIGDQLHPRGSLCEHTYDLVGSVYREVEKREPWCKNVCQEVDIGVITPEAFTGSTTHGSMPKSIFGAVKMLQEAKHQFDVIDPDSDFAPYKLLILPDEIPVSDELKNRIEDYLDNGGKLIASHRAGLDENGDDFNLPLGASYLGDSEFTPLFIKPAESFSRGLYPAEHVMYMGGSRIEKKPEAEILAENVRPYFNRTWRHYCSHQHAPSSGTIDGPGIVRTPNTLYFTHPLFTQYSSNAPRWCKQLLVNAIEALMPDRLLQVEGPRDLIATVNRQPSENRLIIHLLYYTPTRNNERHDTVEETVPLHALQIKMNVKQDVAAVECVPERKPLEFSISGDGLSIDLPELNGYQMISVELK